MWKRIICIRQIIHWNMLCISYYKWRFCNWTCILKLSRSFKSMWFSNQTPVPTHGLCTGFVRGPYNHYVPQESLNCRINRMYKIGTRCTRCIFVIRCVFFFGCQNWFYGWSLRINWLFGVRQSHKSHNALDKYPTMHNEMCKSGHMSWIGLHLFNDDTRPSGQISRPSQVGFSHRC